MSDTITVVPATVTFNAKLTPEQLVGVLTAIASVATIEGLPTGKTLADVTTLNISKIAAGRPDAGGANVAGSIPAA